MAAKTGLKRLQAEETGCVFSDIRPFSGTTECQLVKSNGTLTGVLCDDLSVVMLEAGTGRTVVQTRALDFDLNPFNDLQLLTAGEDLALSLWELPESSVPSVSSPLLTLRGHTKKLSTVCFNPSAAYIAASASLDTSLKIWALERSTVLYSLQPSSTYCHYLQWNSPGSLIASCWKDQFVRIIDPRTDSISTQFQPHDGAKSAKLAWLQTENRLITSGFAKNGDRKVALWDLKNPSKPLCFQQISSGMGLLYPLVDTELPLLFVLGKGERSLHLYQLSDSASDFHLIETIPSPEPMKGVSLVPRRRLPANTPDIVRLMRVTEDKVSEVAVKPRRNESAEDLYPPCTGVVPGLLAAQWTAGGCQMPGKLPLSQTATLPRKGVDFTLIETLVASQVLHNVSSPPSNSTSPPEKNAEITNLKEKIEDLEAENLRLRTLLATYDQLLFGCPAEEYNFD